MAFFENLGRSLSSVGSSVARQTKTLADTAQCNAQIAEKKRQISKLFAEIGEAYYGKHLGDADAESRAEIEQIVSLYQEISDLEDKIRKVKGVMKCPSCGADIPAEASFCNSCGARIVSSDPEPAANTDGTVCPSCGAELGKDDAFCTSCGARIETPAQEKAPETEAADTLKADAAAEGEKNE